MDQMDDDDDLSVSALEPTRASRARAAGVGRALRHVWRASGVVALLALVAIVVVAVAPHLPRVAQSNVQIPSTAVQAPSDVATCLTGVSWSPDSRQIAAVQSSPCGQPYLGLNATQPNLLIFDAATGRQVAAYALDSAVNVALTRVGLKLSSALSYDISYYETRWSPNSRLMAVGFGVYGEFGGDSGMAIVTLTGPQRGQVTALLTPPNTALAYPTNGFDLTPVERWDVTNGTSSTIYLTPALAYRWLPSDVLVADQPLSANPSAAPSVAPTPPTTSATTAGVSADAQTLSMWQIGTISPVTATACAGDGVTTQPLSQPYALLTLSASAWSPDGRYLLDVNVQARLATEPGRPRPASNDASPCDSGLPPVQLPSAPLHDNGLRAALGLLDAYGNTQLTLAWSPDGRRLAVTTLAMAQGTGALAIYDCASGAPLQRFSGAQFEADAAPSSLAQNPVWSPDSAHLLLTIGRPEPKLLILGPQALDVR
jgi:hypothetical protein